MEIYRTEEQQLEAIRTWFRKNGKSTIWMIIVVVAVVLGFRYYLHHQNVIKEKASEHYTLMLDSLNAGDKTTTEKEAGILKKDYKETPYAILAAFALAKEEVDAQKYEAAANELKWAMENAKSQDLKIIANVRLARVYLAMKNWDEVEKVLQQAKADGYLSLLSEVKGDFYVLKQDLSKAKEEYKAAMEADPSKGEKRPLLRMKMEELG